MYFFYGWFVGIVPSMEMTISNLLGLCNRKIKIFFVIEKILLNFY